MGAIEKPRKVLFRNGMVFPPHWHLGYKRTESLFCPYMGIYGSEKNHMLAVETNRRNTYCNFLQGNQFEM